MIRRWKAMCKPVTPITGPIFLLSLLLSLFACADRSGAVDELIITEVMAANKRSLLDQDREPSDWIEIHNPSSDTASLEGWHLTDDPKMPAKWTFPAVKLKAGGYLVIFASQKDRRVSGAELHTNFKLDRDGEFLALTKPDGSIMCQLSPGYPFQIADSSFGVDLASFAAARPRTPEAGTPVRISTLSTNCLRYFPSPTPGTANATGFARLSAAPKINKPGGVYSKSVSIEIKPPGTRAKVHFTLDGSEPGIKSPAYAGAIEISTNTVLKARAFEPDAAPSLVAQETYTLADESMAGFTSNLPLVVINTLGQRLARESQSAMSVRFIDAKGGRAILTGPPDFDGVVRVQYRGYTSMRQPKKSFSLKMLDDASEPRKVPLLGLPQDSDWVLYAPYSDKSLMRDVLAYELSNQMGRYAPRTKFVELFITRPGGRLTQRDYVGVYVLVEKINRSKSRVNIAALQPTDNTEPNVTGGYIFKKDHHDKDDPSFVTGAGIQFFYVEPKGSEITPAQRTWLTRYLNRFDKALQSAQFKDPVRGYPAFIDADSFIDHFWLVEATKNIDGFRFSAFYQLDRGGKLKMEPPWDWNLSFGGAEGRGGGSTSGWYHHTLDEDQQYTWYPRLFQDPDFAQKRIDRWSELRKSVFATDRILARIDTLAAQLKDAQERNFRRWPILGQHIHPNAYVGDTYDQEVRYLKTWTQRRLAWIDGQVPPAPTVTNDNGTTAFQARSGEIYFTTDGSDPRLPGGELSPKAQLYEKPITANSGHRLVIRSKLRNTWSAPAASPPQR